MRTVITLVTKGRLNLLMLTIDALHESDLTDTALYVVDNGSNDGTIDFLKRERERWIGWGKEPFTIILNDSRVPQWQKSYAIRQVLRRLPQDHPNWKHFGWLDDDVVLKPKWLLHARTVLARLPEVAVVSMHQDKHQEKRHKTVRTKELGDLEVRLKRTANGACWLMRRGFFNTYGLPPVDGRSVANCSKDDDTYNRRLRGKAWFGVINMAEHIGYQNSRRRLEMRHKK